MGYLITSMSHIVDTASYKFERIRQSLVAEVPFFLWHQVRDKFSGDFTKTGTLRLNDLRVELQDWEPARGYAQGHQRCSLTFSDSTKSAFSTIEIMALPHYGTIFPQGHKTFGLIDVYYRTVVNGLPKDYCTEMKDVSSVARYRAIGDLARDVSPDGVPDVFNYGISRDKYMVMYNGRRLDGDCHALMLGTYAILLDVNLRFDSLVLLSSVTPTTLVVDAIVHTVNRHVVKVMTLAG